ncbi:MAG TPA: methyltransferase domain-containing protein [Bryobacteraceae bacterium]|nr:methyltransferase domain-containing protein [Bryobacteraceae bacterium]
MLLCTVRRCGAPLQQREHTLICPRGHCFDIARSGYVNLLQPQDRRSRNPGDSPEVVAARRRLHDLGVTRPLVEAIAGIARCSHQVLDAGCGDGFYLGTLASEIGFRGYGIDISTRAADLAARRYPQCEWIVANADRFIPYPDGSFDLVWSIHARMNAGEFRRVLVPGGRLLIALPAPGDLIELRGAGRDRAARTIEEFAAFRLIDRQRVTHVADLSPSAVRDVLRSIYRPFRSKPVEAMRVTFSSDVLLLEPAV